MLDSSAYLAVVDDKDGESGPRYLLAPPSEFDSIVRGFRSEDRARRALTTVERIWRIGARREHLLRYQPAWCPRWIDWQTKLGDDEWRRERVVQRRMICWRPLKATQNR